MNIPVSTPLLGAILAYKVRTKVLESLYRGTILKQVFGQSPMEQDQELAIFRGADRIWPKKRSFHLKILVRRLQSASSQHVLNPNSFLPVFFGQRSIRRT